MWRLAFLCAAADRRLRAQQALEALEALEEAQELKGL